MTNYSISEEGSWLGSVKLYLFLVDYRTENIAKEAVLWQSKAQILLLVLNLVERFAYYYLEVIVLSTGIPVTLIPPQTSRNHRAENVFWHKTSYFTKCHKPRIL